MLTSVVWVHHTVVHRTVGEAQAVAYLVLSHRVEVHGPRVEVRGVGRPVLIFIKMNVTTKVTKLIRIVGMGKN